jgi:hypothetical protein
MEARLKLLNTLLTWFNPELFYVITVYEHDMRLQAYFNPEIVKTAIAHKFYLGVEGNGFIELKRDGIVILLTNK